MSRRLRISALLTLLCGFSAHALAENFLVTVTDNTGMPVVDAIVYAEPSTSAPVTPITKPTTVDIQQKDKKFTPFVSAIQVGTSVNFPNNDTVRHHVYSFSPAKSFELKLYAGKPELPVLFDKAGTVVVGCNIHDQMVAYIKILDTPYFVKTDASGKAKFNQLPTGKFTVKVWHYQQMASISNQEQTIDSSNKDGEAKIAIKLGFKVN
jgi:plastocyanin